MTFYWLLCILFHLCKVPELAFARDPSVDAKVESLVNSFGYPFETHEVVTSDGYILGLHRIPGRSLARPPVLMMHGILGASPDWVVSGPNTSLAFLLHDNGYDVWLGNNRGTTYSKAHLTLHPKDNKYWDFSWNELGLYDTPALIDYILATTNYPKLYYIGFSQGCTQFYVMTSMKPEYNDKVILMSSLAPAAFTGHVQGLLQPFGSFLNVLLMGSDLITSYFEFFPNKGLVEKFLSFVCRGEMYTEQLCKAPIFLLAGTGSQWAKDDVPTILQFSPAGCSTKQLLHYGMGIRDPGQFRQFDYGFTRNLMIYNSATPPAYPLDKITAPVAIYSGVNDFLAHPKDVDLLAGKLPNVVERFEVKEKSSLNHLDFIYGKHIRSLVYQPILETMEMFLPVATGNGSFLHINCYILREKDNVLPEPTSTPSVN